MKRYKLLEGYEVEEENGKVLKRCDVQIYVSEKGLGKERVASMFGLFAGRFAGLVGEEMKSSGGETDSREEET